MYRVRGKGLANVWRMYRVRAKLAKMAILASTRIRQTGEFLASTRIDKFAGEWPLLKLEAM